MAAIRKRRSPVKTRPVRRVSPLKPGLHGARNWATAQVRAASYSRKGFVRLSVSIAFMFFLMIFGALWLGGFLPDVRQAGQNFKQSRLMSMGFVVDRVDVMGEGRLREVDVRAALGVREGDYLFELDIDAAQRRVESLSWVDHAVVRRLWPDRIVVQIIERRPFALWQSEGKLAVIDAEGVLITDANPLQYTDLTMVVGKDASAEVTEFQATLADFADISSRIDAMVYVGQRRWDLRMDEGQLRVKLPADNPRLALETLRRLQAQTQILDREIDVIDLRLPGRMTVSPPFAKGA